MARRAGFFGVTLAWKEIRHRPVHAGLFAASLAVGTASLMALAGVSEAVKQHVTAQAKELWAADLTVKGSDVVLDDVDTWARARWPGLVTARSVDVLSMVQHRAGRKTGLVTLCAVTEGYPLHGKIFTGSGRSFHDVLKPGSIVVAERLLRQWKIAVGDVLRLGALDGVIADTVVGRTDAPTSIFELSPVVFLTLSDLERSKLMAPGSRSINTLYLNGPPGTDLAILTAEVKARAASETTEVAGWSTDNPGIYQFIRQTLLYLDFLALLGMTLGGIGAATALSAALKAATHSVGTWLALGSPRGFVTRVWVWWVGILALVGLSGALALARPMAQVLIGLFGDMIPGGTPLVFPWRSLLPSAGVGLVSAGLFAAYPLSTLGAIPPNRIFSDEIPALSVSRWRSAGIVGTGAAIFFLLAWAQVDHFRRAAQYVAVIGGLVVLGGGTVAGVMGTLRWLLGRFPGLYPRLTARGLARPGQLNDAVVFSISLSLSVILTLFLLEKNILAHTIERFPVTAPNAFFINIQPSQADLFRRIVGDPAVRLFPLVRGRVTEVNDISVQEVNRRADRWAGGDRLTREFGFSFGEDIPPTDRVSEGPALWNPAIAGPQVSVFDEYQKRFGLRRGDRITVSVLGRRFEATVSSFRSIDRSVRQPFFYFYFRPGLLDPVPHTLMGGMSVSLESLPDLHNRLAESLPNVTVVDVSDVAALTGRLVRRLGRVVRALGLFGLSSGLLLLVSSLLASLASRSREAALFRTLGATRAQVVLGALWEYGVIAGAGGGSAWALGLITSGVVLDKVFGLKLIPFLGPTCGLVGSVGAGMVLISWAMTATALRTPPAQALRHE